MENDENDIKFCLFSMILKNSQVTFYQWIETFFYSMAIVELNFWSNFLDDSQG